MKGLFGEGPADRRERLRQLIAQLGDDIIKRKKEKERETEKVTPETAEVS